MNLMPRFRFLHGWHPCVFLLILLLSGSALQAQTETDDSAVIDSLQQVVENAPHDSAVVKALYVWHEKVYMEDRLQGVTLLERAIAICNTALDKTLNSEETFFFSRWRADARYGMAQDYIILGDTAQIIKLGWQALEEYEALKLRRDAVRPLTMLAGEYSTRGRIEKALALYEQGIAYAEQEDYLVAEIVLTGNIGVMFWKQEEFDLAMEYFEQAYEMAYEAGDLPRAANPLNNIGIIHYQREDYDQALVYFKRALEIRREEGDQQGIAQSLSNVGLIYKVQGDLETAIEYYLQALELDEKYSKPEDHARTIGNMGTLYNAYGDYKRAAEYLNQSLKAAKSVGDLNTISTNYEGLAEAYSKQGDYRQAFEALELHIVFKDSLKNIDNQAALIKHDLDMEYARKSAADSVKVAEAQKVTDAQLLANEAQIERDAVLRYSLFGGIAVLLITALIVFKRLQVTRRQKVVIEAQKKQVEQQKSLVENQKLIVEEKHKEITDSINYAKRIQFAILPPDKMVKEYLPSSFVYYQPKDIVAGDFYWMEPCVLPSGGKSVLFAAADCTGHGVPGALVSVVCNNGLNRSVREFGLREPGQILDKTREIVIQEFEKSEEEVKDGMDIALCYLEGTTLSYAGANNPLWIVRNGEILETKANKQPIGQFHAPVPYTTHQFELEKGDTIYVFSDGFVDQFGGEKGKKFKARAFRALLLSIQSEPMDRQHTLIHEAFENWRGSFEQIDDVCVLGVRIS